MIKFPTFLLAACLLAACSGNPFTVTEEGTGEETATPEDIPATPEAPTAANPIPASLALNLQAATYNPDAGTLVLRLSSLDAGVLDTTYQRTPALDRPGYLAFTVQDDPLDRHVTAMVARSSDPQASVQAGVASDGGQFNTYFSGGFYQRNADFTPPAPGPDGGLVSYAGTYAGVTNVNAPGTELLPVAPGTNPAILPAQSAQTTGTIFLNVDFSNNAVNGAIIERSLIQYGLALPDVVLRVADIAPDGTFYGDLVQYSGVPAGDIGDYGGIFGGTEAAAVGGVVALTEFDGQGNPLGLEAEREVGVFVLSRCGISGSDATLCADAN
ncbi:MAG: thymidylate synthase [Paracoccaceae bacterium]|jgi:hypothetical protein|nr:thymidylate synthase [Paracoccaceae bacterium]